MWIEKIWGAGAQRAGIPDFLCCIEGVFIGLEVKHPNNKNTEGTLKQKKCIRDIEKAGGVAGIVMSPDEAYHLVRKALKKKRMK